ncbi:tRNA (N6-threonylcarbamoyladenosine(37)-N6)-methyltransferase TrmO [Aliidiomarina minuta]|uniref:tRNA (adenine(37)-N6)-methyltransferase n=1 Tax=Aliidiomarina minuta TaxID=880057 RepID=A0A432W5M9_9GAMM|nr:tRNA (N6-threonylcarbamoyladenosine(37)-N6)-methyltransferase TrmO [Aliidiomarina minuta]RUO25367.1 tRNA (N6-threonylcarbamoyladenosine(37)-N6)-methyltransferase TrmO [Aliidiomarina minuta]
MYQFNTVGYVQSPYREKFAIPRQPGLVSSAQGRLILTDDYNRQECIAGLEDFSHIWIQFVFHATAEQGWKPKVRPPRLGGNRKVGIFATRSTFRPNPIGLSVVKLEEILYEDKHWQLVISGLDLLDKTPVLDIKPYIAYSDALTEVSSGFAQEAPQQQMPVNFSPQALKQLDRYHSQYPQLKLLIEQVLAQDPRPAYRQHKDDNKTYGMQLYQLNIRWQVMAQEAVVTAVSDC